MSLNLLDLAVLFDNFCYKKATSNLGMWPEPLGKNYVYSISKYLLGSLKHLFVLNAIECTGRVYECSSGFE